MIQQVMIEIHFKKLLRNKEDVLLIFHFSSEKPYAQMLNS